MSGGQGVIGSPAAYDPRSASATPPFNLADRLRRNVDRARALTLAGLVAKVTAFVLGRNKQACLADETDAQNTLKQNWSKYPATDKTICSGMTTSGGPASYVELVSCLEILRDAKSIEATDPLAGGDMASGTSRAESPKRHDFTSGVRTTGADITYRVTGQPCWCRVRRGRRVGGGGS
jgi:hypothetical protein